MDVIKSEFFLFIFIYLKLKKFSKVKNCHIIDIYISSATPYFQELHFKNTLSLPFSIYIYMFKKEGDIFLCNGFKIN